MPENCGLKRTSMEPVSCRLFTTCSTRAQRTAVPVSSAASYRKSPAILIRIRPLRFIKRKYRVCRTKLSLSQAQPVTENHRQSLYGSDHSGLSNGSTGCAEPNYLFRVCSCTNRNTDDTPCHVRR